MAILSKYDQFATAVSVAHAAGTVLLGDVYDTGNDGVNFAEDLYFVITVDTGIITGGSAGTIQFKLSSDSTADLATSPTDHYISASIATGATATALAAGKTLVNVELPTGVYERYLGVLYIIGTTTTTAGKVNAFLTPGFNRWKALAAAI